MSSPVNRILATTSTINQDPAMWGFWIMSSPGSRFLDLLNTFYIQAIPTLWGFWIMSRPVSRVFALLYTTTPQPNTPTSYLPACRFRRWVGLLARTLRGFPNQSQIKSPAIRPPQVGNDGKAGPPGYVGKTATQPLNPWFCCMKFGLFHCHTEIPINGSSLNRALLRVNSLRGGLAEGNRISSLGCWVIRWICHSELNPGHFR